MPDLMETHRDLLARWRKSMNLVGPGEVEVHFDDCRLALAGLSPEGRWVDLGSGAGFPGLVLAALWPELEVDLVDSRQKRCVFLEAVLGEAGVPPDRVRVIRGRVEDLPDGAGYAGLVARAFKGPDVVLDFARRLLRAGGTVVLFLQDEAPVPDDPDFEVFHVERYEVDGKRRKSAALRRVT